MSNYFCPECGYEGEEPICPHCNRAAEPLNVSEDSFVQDNSPTYSKDLMKSIDPSSVVDVDSPDQWKEQADEK